MGWNLTHTADGSDSDGDDEDNSHTICVVNTW